MGGVTGTVLRVMCRRDLRRWGAVVLPGIAVYVVLWLATVMPFDYRGATSYDMDFLWQSLGRGFLSTDPWGSLSVLHIQPPGLNALFAVDLALTPVSHTLLLVTNVVATVATIALICDALLRATRSGVAALVAGVVYALLPGTVLYSLYAYNTTLTALFAIVAVWPLTWSRNRMTLAVTISSLGALGLVLTRSSFVWIAMAVWCIALILWCRRRVGITWPRVLGAALPLAAVLLIQLHYLVSFQLPFMSSWSGQNLAKALQTSGHLTVTPQARDALASTTCHNAIFQAWQQGELNIWDPGGLLRQPGCRDLPPVIERGVPAWDSPLKADSQEMNYNEGRALVASAQWSGLMTTIVRSDPWQLVRMATTSPTGFGASGIGLYLTASDDYPFLDPAREHLPTTVIAGPLASAFGPALWTLVILGWVGAAVRRTSTLRRQPAFWFASGLLVYHALVSTLLEYSENMRYRAEVDSVLLVAGVLAAVSLVGELRRIWLRG
jgi:hypothetical protein